ncbi:hypothetical protein [Salinarimonas sp.]|uniref:hypothetical protein n=1 Tax=Salinarimonas sp. TaxID=2766526 RepID=UPI00391CFE6C
MTTEAESKTIAKEAPQVAVRDLVSIADVDEELRSIMAQSQSCSPSLDRERVSALVARRTDLMMAEDENGDEETMALRP